MILCPLQNTAEKYLGLFWRQVRPVVTQKFGARPEYYKQFELDGHEGVDFRAAVGTPVFAPIDGRIGVSHKGPYGTHITITNSRLRVILAHLSSTTVKSGDYARMGEMVGKTGNTGNSQAPHLHVVCQRMKNKTIQDRNNGYLGGFDFEPYVITWKGGLLDTTF